MIPGDLKVGWRIRFLIGTYVMPLAMGPLLRARLPWLAKVPGLAAVLGAVPGLALRWWGRWRLGRGDQNVRIERQERVDAGRLATFWQQVRENPPAGCLLQERTAEYLAWRFDGNPNRQYLFHLATDPNGVVQGYVVSRKAPLLDVQAMTVVDACLLPGASELVLRRKDGSPVSVFSSHAMRADARGEPEMYCIDVDLTALKRAEQEIAGWRERYRTAILASGQVIREWDPATGAQSIFGDTRRILGHASEALAGGLDRWRALLHPEDQPRFDGEAARSRATGTPFRLGYRMRHRDGEWLFVEDNGYFVRDAAGAIDCLVCFVVDVTARHRADERIREQLEALRRWHAAMLGREGRLLDLKREVNALMARLGEPPRYPSAEAAASTEAA